jgi:acid stress chaperone HdeB
MTKSALVVSALTLTTFVVPAAQAQVTVEVSKITCEEFASYKVTDPEKIAIWLSGYYHGKQGKTSLDRIQLNENTKKLEEYCIQNGAILVMQAFEKLFGESK